MRYTVFKRTNDDWCPSYGVHINSRHNPIKDRGNLVEVTFLKFPTAPGYRTCVWGADDMGMDFDG